MTKADAKNESNKVRKSSDKLVPAVVDEKEFRAPGPTPAPLGKPLRITKRGFGFYWMPTKSGLDPAAQDKVAVRLQRTIGGGGGGGGSASGGGSDDPNVSGGGGGGGGGGGDAEWTTFINRIIVPDNGYIFFYNGRGGEHGVGGRRVEGVVDGISGTDGLEGRISYVFTVADGQEDLIKLDPPLPPFTNQATESKMLAYGSVLRAMINGTIYEAPPNTPHLRGSATRVETNGVSIGTQSFYGRVDNACGDIKYRNVVYHVWHTAWGGFGGNSGLGGLRYSTPPVPNISDGKGGRGGNGAFGFLVYSSGGGGGGGSIAGNPGPKGLAQNAGNPYETPGNSSGDPFPGKYIPGKNGQDGNIDGRGGNGGDSNFSTAKATSVDCDYEFWGMGGTACNNSPNNSEADDDDDLPDPQPDPICEFGIDPESTSADSSSCVEGQCNSESQDECGLSLGGAGGAGSGKGCGRNGADGNCATIIVCGCDEICKAANGNCPIQKPKHPGAGGGGGSGGSGIANHCDLCLLSGKGCNGRRGANGVIVMTVEVEEDNDGNDLPEDDC